MKAQCFRNYKKCILENAGDDPFDDLDCALELIACVRRTIVPWPKSEAKAESVIGHQAGASLTDMLTAIVLADKELRGRVQK